MRPSVAIFIALAGLASPAPGADAASAKPKNLFPVPLTEDIEPVDAPASKGTVVPHPVRKEHYDNMLSRQFPEEGQAISQELGYTGERIAEDSDAALGNVTDDINRLADNVRDSFHRTGDHVKEWWFTRYTHPSPQAVQPSYCYRALQDVLCYRQPVPGWEHRLVGYQGTYAAAPPPAMTRPMPALVVDESTLPANRIANAAPVFKDIPEEQEPIKATPGEIVLDPAMETLPDPAMAPQL